MALGTYKIPDALKDEDKWFKFFTKTQCGAMICALVSGLMLLAFFSKLHLFPVGLALLVVDICCVGVAVMVRIPEEHYLMGAGELIGTVVLRVIKKRMSKNRVIYIKNYDA